MVLVTGASGFIGRHLVKVLLERGHKVRAVSRKDFECEGERVFVGNIDGRTDWSAALRGVDQVVHLAAETGQSNSGDKKLLYQVNADGTAKIARDAIRAKVRHFIYVSSIGAMAEDSETVLQADQPCRPVTDYGKSKEMGENLLKWYSESGGLPYTIFRPPVIYGRGNKGNIGHLLKIVNLGIPLPFKELKNRRSFLYVRNFVEIVDRSLTKAVGSQKVYLPSDGDDVSTPDLVRAIRKGIWQASEPGKNPQPNPSYRKRGHDSAHKQDINFSFPPKLLKIISRIPGMGPVQKLTTSLYVDSSPMMDDLAWKPRFTLEEGMMETAMDEMNTSKL